MKFTIFILFHCTQTISLTNIKTYLNASLIIIINSKGARLWDTFQIVPEIYVTCWVYYSWLCQSVTFTALYVTPLRPSPIYRRLIPGGRDIYFIIPHFLIRGHTQPKLHLPHSTESLPLADTCWQICKTQIVANYAFTPEGDGSTCSCNDTPKHLCW